MNRRDPDTFVLPPPDAPGGRIGTDEAGKGDYFGPLVVAAVYVHDQTETLLRQAGVRDSKKLTDGRIHELAASIRHTCPVRLVVIGPERYNSLYADMRNLNRLLAWAHGRVIEDLLAQVDSLLVVSDQFAEDSVLRSALQARGRKTRLEQRPRAEEDTAVAAASIIARGEFLSRLARLSATVGLRLPKGAGPPVLSAGAQYVCKYGADALGKVAKLHFRTTRNLIGSK